MDRLSKEEIRGKILLILNAAALCFTLSPSAFAGGNFEANPDTFVGKAGDCGSGYPAGSHIVTAKWLKGIGLPDNGGDNRNGSDPSDNPNKTDHHSGLLLSKNGPTPDCSSAGAKIAGVKNLALTEIGFDIRNGTRCGAGAPRFNVQATDGFHFLGGCSNGTLSTSLLDPAWTRVRIDPTNPAQAFPPIAAGATIKSIEIVFDEGTEDPVEAGAGLAVIDNIDINGALIGAHGDDND